MAINNFVFGFAMFITLLFVVMFLFMGKEFKKMKENERLQRGHEEGPRAYVFDQLYEFFSADENEESIDADKKLSEIKRILREKKSEDQ